MTSICLSFTRRRQSVLFLIWNHSHHAVDLQEPGLLANRLERWLAPIRGLLFLRKILLVRHPLFFYSPLAFTWCTNITTVNLAICSDDNACDKALLPWQYTFSSSFYCSMHFQHRANRWSSGIAVLLTSYWWRFLPQVVPANTESLPSGSCNSYLQIKHGLP